MAKLKARICVLSGGHASTCPRMLKAADALFEAGYAVRVVSARFVDWATRADEHVRQSRSWKWDEVDYRRSQAPWNYWRGGVRFRGARALARMAGPRHCPPGLAARGYSRVYSELLAAAVREPADLYYGCTGCGLAVASAAARRHKVPFALDLEDFHSAEQSPGPEADLSHRLVERIEAEVLGGAAFLTAASEGIASSYERKYGVLPITIHNTFPLPAREPDFEPGGGHALRLYWFSQTIGPNRGLEDAVRAIGLSKAPCEMHVRGRAIPGYLEELRRLANEVAEALLIVHHEPAPPDTMVELSRGYDVGLALEPCDVLNHAICLSNKAFTYILGGLAVAFTDTPGQRVLALDLGPGALLYPPGQPASLAEGLRRWAESGDLLRRAKIAAWEAAKRRWHWEHAQERGALLAAVAGALHE